MTRMRRPRLRWQGAAAGLLASTVAMACATPKPETEDPTSAEDERASLAAYDPEQASAGAEVDADKAAKQAAAQKVLKKVKDRDPEEEKKKMARSRAISKEARAKLAKGQMKEAVGTARQALKIHEQNVDAMLVIAEVYQKQGKFELVRAVTSSALQVDPKTRTPEDSSRAYNLQGFAMLAMGDGNPATMSFKKAAEVDDKNAAAWNNLGTRYLDAGDVATATACFSYAIELDPRFYKAQLNYGAALRASQKPEEAEKVFQQALKLRPNYPEAYFNLGVLYLDADPFPGLDTTQRLNKAIRNLSKYQDLAPADREDGKQGNNTLRGSGAAQAPPPRVSKARADDYIRVANKGLDREARRLERDKERQAPANAAGGDPAAAGDPGAATAAGAGTAAGATKADGPANGGAPQGPDAGGGAPDGPGATEPKTQGPGKPTTQGPGKPTPAKPTTQGPGKPTPAKPTTQGPGKPTPAKPTTQGPGTPSKPTTQGPGKPSSPTQPAPTKPSPTPVKPTPVKPTPVKPTPVKPTPVKPTPVKPTPVKPTPVKPTPVKPTPVKPTPVKPTPVKPTPVKPGVQKPGVQKPGVQKPGVQKPQSVGWRPPRSVSKKFDPDRGSRGTRSAASTLNSMEAGASTTGQCVAFAFGPRSPLVMHPPQPTTDEPMVSSPAPASARATTGPAPSVAPLHTRSSQGIA